MKNIQRLFNIDIVRKPKADKLIFENENVKSYQDQKTKEVYFKFKPNCPQQIVEMWKKLNEPISSKHIEKVADDMMGKWFKQ